MNYKYLYLLYVNYSRHAEKTLIRLLKSAEARTNIYHHTGFVSFSPVSYIPSYENFFICIIKSSDMQQLEK